jgi:DNA repair exonuclease SbcCD ATPase subunit
MDTVFQKRLGRDEERDNNADGMTATELMRSAAETSRAESTEARNEEKISIFWRVFGGTILSIVALAVITLYNSISSNISDLRNELNREREARADLVKKDEFNSRTTSQYERMRSYESLKIEQEGLKERLSANAAAVDGIKKDSTAALDAMKKDIAGASDAAKKDSAALEVLKERMTSATADLKGVRDNVEKMQQEVERNKAGDNERKLARDAQYKQVEDTLKELQKGLQACREKLARLEGAQPGAARGASSPGPIAPATSKPIPPDDND